SPRRETLVPEAIPYIGLQAQGTIRAVYMSAPDHKALAISRDSFGMSTGQRDTDTAKTAALATCQRFSGRSALPGSCELYAVGNAVPSTHGPPPMPPQPWIIRDRATERSFVLTEVPLVDDATRRTIELEFLQRDAPKALALSADGKQASYAATTSA